MSYVKTQWVDNTTPIDSTNMNKIEQGIYDNSLVADAVNTTVKPSESALAEPVEITEGQITDVLAVNDVLIKGNTLQDGEPTPSSPIDVNVVSGSNVINTSNKNLFDKATIGVELGGYAGSNGVKYSSTTRIRNVNPFKLSAGSYTLSCSNATIVSINKVGGGNEIGVNSNKLNFTLSTTQSCLITIETTDLLNANIQIELGSTATTYTPHQGKELPLDLPVENLVDMGNKNPPLTLTIENETNNSFDVTTSSDINYEQTIYFENINLVANTTYYIQRKVEVLSGTAPSGMWAMELYSGGVWKKVILGSSSEGGTFTVDVSGIYRVRLKLADSNTNSYKVKISDVQIEKGSKANTYTPYGTTPIELCKIGNYQDYFYRDYGKWYLHKEVGKLVFDGSENWILENNNMRFGRYNITTGAKTRNNTGICSQYSVYEQYATINNSFGVGEDNVRLYNTNNLSLVEFKQSLSVNNLLIYYLLETATNTEITDTTLISQLEAIYNAPLYEQTNISQDNNDLPIILDITAFKDNINGIKAWIRK